MFEVFSVAIWFSMSPTNVVSAVNLICTEVGIHKEDFYFIYDQTDCSKHPTKRHPTKLDVPFFLKEYQNINKTIDFFQYIINR